MTHPNDALGLVLPVPAEAGPDRAPRVVVDVVRVAAGVTAVPVDGHGALVGRRDDLLRVSCRFCGRSDQNTTTASSKQSNKKQGR